MQSFHDQAPMLDASKAYLIQCADKDHPRSDVLRAREAFFMKAFSKSPQCAAAGSGRAQMVVPGPDNARGLIHVMPFLVATFTSVQMCASIILAG